MLRKVAPLSQLTYQPAFDPFHATFRLLRLRNVILKYGNLPRDLVRILDFYLLFPFRVREIRLKPAHRRHKSVADNYAHLKPYGDAPESSLIFARMEPMQAAALETLAAQGFIAAGALAGDKVQADREPPHEVASRVADRNATQADLMTFLDLLASEYNLLGAEGLKARTALMDFRYDAV
jgi:hypothetical protein